jgi:CheY-like chemotaxis protein
MTDFKSCLLIDDDKDDQDIFLMALEEVNNSIDCALANNAKGALEMLHKQYVPDIIFIDLNMPKINGKTCLLEIKKMPHLKDVPICIYSTSANERDKKETTDLGAVAFITKPSSIDELASILSEIFVTHKKV